LIFKFKKTYRGEIIGCAPNYEEVDTNRYVYDIGDRVGQIVILPYPQVEFEEVEELSNTERGGGGFGHTGK
jgi:dUTP pyrophosphatase